MIETEDNTNKEKSTDFMSDAQAMFKALTGAGLDTCFANPGTSEMQLVYEADRKRTRRSLPEETVVTEAASGCARMAGKRALAAVDR